MDFLDQLEQACDLTNKLSMVLNEMIKRLESRKEVDSNLKGDFVICPERHSVVKECVFSTDPENKGNENKIRCVNNHVFNFGKGLPAKWIYNKRAHMKYHKKPHPVNESLPSGWDWADMQYL